MPNHQAPLTLATFQALRTDDTVQTTTGASLRVTADAAPAGGEHRAEPQVAFRVSLCEEGGSPVEVYHNGINVVDVTGAKLEHLG